MTYDFSEPFATKLLPKEMDCLAPDGSQIRELVALPGATCCHCTLPVAGISKAVIHKTVSEIWYFLTGTGQVWRKSGDRESTVEVSAGCALSIPQGTAFQFKNTGTSDLVLVFVTIPPWPGPDEAEPTVGPW
jgi:mannose-6-phosphate isomerase-like protein (cupin superfamily)